MISSLACVWYAWILFDRVFLKWRRTHNGKTAHKQSPHLLSCDCVRSPCICVHKRRQPRTDRTLIPPAKISKDRTFAKGCVLLSAAWSWKPSTRNWATAVRCIHIYYMTNMAVRPVPLPPEGGCLNWKGKACIFARYTASESEWKSEHLSSGRFSTNIDILRAQHLLLTLILLIPAVWTLFVLLLGNPHETNLSLLHAGSAHELHHSRLFGTKFMIKLHTRQYHGEHIEEDGYTLLLFAGQSGQLDCTRDRSLESLMQYI